MDEFAFETFTVFHDMAKVANALKVHSYSKTFYSENEARKYYKSFRPKEPICECKGILKRWQENGETKTAFLEWYSLAGRV